MLLSIETDVAGTCPNGCMAGCRFRLLGDNQLGSECAFRRRSRAAAFETQGFLTSVQQSSLPCAGRGVFVAEGTVQKGQLVALYPGEGTDLFPSDLSIERI